MSEVASTPSTPGSASAVRSRSSRSVRLFIAVGRAEDARGKLEKVIELNLSQSMPAAAARAYALMAGSLDGLSDEERSQLKAQAVALYLASGLDAQARELSKTFIPSDNSQAVQMLRREFSQVMAEEPARAEEPQ